MRAKSLTIFLSASLLSAAALSACAPQVDVRGHVPRPAALSEIKPGHQNRDQVAELLGSPSAIGTFEDDRWYYITRQTESTAFFDPELVDQQIVMIEFDHGGFVKTISNIDRTEAQEVDFVSRVTPTHGRKFGFFEQVFGNLGLPTGRE